MRTLRHVLYSTAVAVSLSMAGTGCVDDPVSTASDSEALGVSAASKLATPAPGAQLIPDRYIVTFKEDMVPRGVQAAEVRDVAASLMAERGMSEAAITHVYSSAISGFAAVMTERQALRLAQDPAVALIEQDQVARASVTWGLDRTDQRDLPLDNVYSNKYGNGSGTHSYVIDTGIRLTHNEFTGRMGNGFDAVTSGGNANDCNGHGTHVAGTVGGTTYGMATGTILHPVRVLDCNGSGSYAGVVAGIDWVTANHIKPAVANMSLGGGASSTVDNAVTNSINAGVTYAVAAGNDNKDACNYSPARTPAALTVGSTTSSDARSSFSNWGTCVDIFAPGSSITAAWHTSDTATNTISGTSMASPHVAGAVALYLGANPSATPAQVEAALEGDATTGKVTSAGTGSPNLLLYVGSGSAPPPPPPPPPGNVLTKGVPVSNLSASQGNWLHFTMDVPSGSTNLTFSISGGSGDADLYVKYGSQPTTTSYDCRPYKNGNNETCSFATPAAGTWYVSLRAYTSFSGVTLVGDYAVSGGYPGNELDETGLGASQGNWIYRQITVPGDATKLTVKITGGTGDADLYVRFGSQPTTTSYNCRPYLNGNEETCTFSPPQAGTYYIGIRAYTTFSSVRLIGDYE
jgi:serine protease